MKRILLFLATTVILLPAEISAQCDPAGSDTLHGNKVAALIHNGGDMGWDLSANPAYIVPYTSVVANQRHSMFAGSIWLGSLDGNLDIHTAAQTYRQSGTDFFNGPFRTTGNYACDSVVTFSSIPYYDGMFRHSSGKVLAFYSSGADLWDPATNTVSNIIFPVQRLNYSVVELANQQVLISCQNAGVAEPVILLTPPNFVPSTGITLQMPHSLSTPVVLSNGKVLLVGNTVAELYDPAGPSSALTTSPAIPHVNSSAITLNNGMTFFSGGGTNGTTTSELFDPTTNTWSAGPTLLVARTGHALIKLMTGEVLLIGGSNTNTQIELYDPVTNGTSPFGDLQRPAKYLSASLLANGKVLITSWNTTSGIDGTMELFDPALQTSVTLTSQNVNARSVLLPNGNVLVQKSGVYFHQYNPVTGEFLNSKWNHIWRIKAAEISQFLNDFTNGSVNFANYPNIETWPGNGNTLLGEDHYLAPFVDVNQDGWYKPEADGDYPCITGDEMLWYVMNDDAGAHTETGGLPLGVQVEVSAWAVNCGSTPCPDPSLDYTTFYHYEVINKSGQSQSRFRLGYWSDSDLGNYQDDYVGCDTTREMGFCYNGDSNDEANLNGYGTNPPAIGVVVLNDPESKGLDGFVYYANDFSVTGNPQNATNFYNYLNGKWIDGTSIVDNGTNGYGAGTATSFMYPGDAGWCGGAANGWTEVSAGNNPFDRRMLINTAHTPFAADDTLIYDFAIVWSRGTAGPVSSVCELQSDADAVTSWWNSQNFSCFNLVMGRSEELMATSRTNHITIYPNPTESQVTVQMPHGKVQGGGHIEVTNLMGKILYAQNVPAGAESIYFSLNDLPMGIYLVTAKLDGETFVERLVISK